MLHKFTTSTFLSVLIALASCGTTKNTQTTLPKEERTISIASKAPTYNIYYYASNTLTLPNDEITIDSTAYVIYTSQQKMQTGNWRSPKGVSFLEPEDKDTLYSILSDTSLFHINSDDVSPECPDGSELRIKITRSDLRQSLAITTNTCASEYNLLSGATKKQFKRLLAYFEKMRTNYRPKYPEKGKR